MSSIRSSHKNKIESNTFASVVANTKIGSTNDPPLNTLNQICANFNVTHCNTKSFPVRTVSLPIHSTPPVNHSRYDLSPHKVSNIIFNWYLKFSGDENECLTVDNFLHRVQALTMQSLRGNIELLYRTSTIVYELNFRMLLEISS